MSSSFSDPSGIANQSATECFSDVFKARLSRRQVLKGVSALPLLGLGAGCAAPGMRNDSGSVSFTPISASTEDRVRVPSGYSATPLYSWGDPVGSAAGMPDLIAGRLAMFIDVAATGIGWANRGELRALGVSADRRLAQLPQVPTFAEAGVKDAESYTWHMVMAPAGTPAPVLAQANAACNRVAADPAVVAKLTDLAMTLRADTTPETARRFLLDEEAKWSAVISNAGIRVE